MSKVMLVTGGARGIGAATAKLAAAEGYRVALCYRKNSDAADALVSDIEKAGGAALAVKADVAVESDVTALFETIDREFGRIDALVNNAGVTAGDSLVADIRADQLQEVFAVNVFGAFLCAREAVRRMSTAAGGQGGAIVNISSGASKTGSPGTRVHYAATKGAIDTMTLGLAREVATQGIRVNAVRAGVTETDAHGFDENPALRERMTAMIPVRRIATTDEIAETVLWLLSDKASYVTASLVDAGGGI